MDFDIVPPEAERHLDWLALTDALEAGHRFPKADIGDTFLYRDPDTVLSRAAWIDGMGVAVKTATVFPGNPDRGRAVVGGGVNIYSDVDGRLEALIDFALVTKWKTAGDSLLAARKLAPPDVGNILLVGAGQVGASLFEAYSALFPTARFQIWSRRKESQEAFAAKRPNVTVADDLAEATPKADIVACATMTTEPLLQGAWLRPGQHVDLIGAYRHDMREADDEVMRRGRVFVDSFDTTLDHIGELIAPISNGAIDRDSVIADYYGLAHWTRAPDDITVFKNGGGAHLDLMTCRYILEAWRSAKGGSA